MNLENLRELIKRYEANLEELNNTKNDEVFKWRAVRRFQDVWFSPDRDERPFAEIFSAAKSESDVLLDGSTMSPATGIVKMAEAEPEEVRRLFCDVLFSDFHEDLSVLQKQMDDFLEGIEAVRQKHFPKQWKFKQDRHSASVYLSLYAPEKHFIYKYSTVETFAKYIEFGKDLGSGTSFKLVNYYDLCNQVVSELRQHSSLLLKHFSMLDEKCYYDKSLHLLVFDLIYCTSTYGLYAGMHHQPKSASLKAYTKEIHRLKEEQKKQNLVKQLEDEILSLELKIEEYRTINLLGVEVYQKQHGAGIVVDQNINLITVKHSDVEKKYIISNRFSNRPTFEDDKEIVDAMTDYETITREVQSLNRKKQHLLSQMK